MMNERRPASENAVAGIIIKLAGIASALYGLRMAWIYASAAFWTKFTQFSNLGVGLIFVVFLMLDLLRMISRGRIDGRARWLYELKFMMTVSVLIAAVMYGFFLGPVRPNGLLEGYATGKWGSLFEHVVTPLIALIDLYVCDWKFECRKRDSLLAVVPVLIYYIYAFILSFTGMTWKTSAGEVLHVPYNFLNYQAPCGWVGIDIGHFDTTTVGMGVVWFILISTVCFIILAFILLLLLRLRERIRERRIAKTEREQAGL